MGFWIAVLFLAFIPWISHAQRIRENSRHPSVLQKTLQDRVAKIHPQFMALVARADAHYERCQKFEALYQKGKDMAIQETAQAAAIPYRNVKTDPMYHTVTKTLGIPWRGPSNAFEGRRLMWGATFKEVEVDCARKFSNIRRGNVTVFGKDEFLLVSELIKNLQSAPRQYMMDVGDIQIYRLHRNVTIISRKKVTEALSPVHEMMDRQRWLLRELDGMVKDSDKHLYEIFRERIWGKIQQVVMAWSQWYYFEGKEIESAANTWRQYWTWTYKFLVEDVEPALKELIELTDQYLHELIQTLHMLEEDMMFSDKHKYVME